MRFWLKLLMSLMDLTLSQRLKRFPPGATHSIRWPGDARSGRACSRRRPRAQGRRTVGVTAACSVVTATSAAASAGIAVDPGGDGREGDRAGRRARRPPRGCGGSTRPAARARPACRPCQTGPTVWITQRAGQRRSPRWPWRRRSAHPPRRRQASSRPGPAARWMAPSTPPPPSSDELAALTIASTAKRGDVGLHGSDRHPVQCRLEPGAARDGAPLQGKSELPLAPGQIPGHDHSVVITDVVRATRPRAPAGTCGGSELSVRQHVAIDSSGSHQGGEKEAGHAPCSRRRTCGAIVAGLRQLPRGRS